VQSSGPQAFPQEHGSLPMKENHPSEETARDNGADSLTLWLRCLPTSAVAHIFSPLPFCRSVAEFYSMLLIEVSQYFQEGSLM
jgi:hypothetical protein